ncbi:LytR/AlgR family response regulator transcription factor [Flavitalea flava]
MQSFFFIRQDGRNVKVDFHQILYIEARKNYTRLVMTDRSAMVLVTLKQWEKILPSDLFCRVHRGYIVSIERIISFDNKFVYLPGMNISIGDQFKNALAETVMIVASEPVRKEEVLSVWESVEHSFEISN